MSECIFMQNDFVNTSNGQQRKNYPEILPGISLTVRGGNQDDDKNNKYQRETSIF